MKKSILIRGARQHNLKNVDLEIPHNSFTVITGPSGSGKSSLAFDILYAEGQRRYIESLSTYARHFIEQLDKPDVDSVEGLSPTIAIENRQIATNPRSTVGTITEIYDFLRLLFARLGEASCPKCHRRIRVSHPEDTVNDLISNHQGAKILILSPTESPKGVDLKRSLKTLIKEGFIRVRVNGKILEIPQVANNPPENVTKVEVVIDRLVVDPKRRSRLTDSVELAYKIGSGKVVIYELPDKEYVFTDIHACHFCGVKLPEPTPRLFSFNNPEGACPHCDGLGVEESFDPDLIISNPHLSIRDGAIGPWANKNSVTFYEQLESLARHYKFSIDTPFKEIPERAKNAILYGSGNEEVPFHHYVGEKLFIHKRPFVGLVPFLKKKLAEAKTQDEKREVEQYIRKNPCSRCGGTRLRKEALSFTYEGLTIADISSMSVKEALNWFKSIKGRGNNNPVASRIFSEVISRLELLINIGLHYLTLDRPATTLSGGETQRIRLANQIGSRLVGVTYILDEPSVGMHPYDHRRLLHTLISLKELGNTVVVVEHDRETIMAADHVIDIGPGAGVNGGKIIFSGPPRQLLQCKNSLTAGYLSGSLRVFNKRRRKPVNDFLIIKGASSFNLKSIDVKIPLGLFTCITGVSGSGKSTLLFHTLFKALQKFLHGRKNIVHGEFKALEGWQKLGGVIHVSQGPIGKSPRSNPATYIGLFSQIRALFARLPESRARGFNASRFSFNIKGGRCEMCKGDGQLRIQMHFLPDIYITCPSCSGSRYNSETLEVKYKGKNISEVLDLTVNQALEHFANIPSFQSKLQVLKDVGLGYIKLGQPANTLSTGESQRVKLAKELTRRSGNNILFLLDEPTTGLHLDDINRLLETLHMLVDRGNTVVTIEHNMDFVSSADWIIDLGPGGGEQGGTIVAEGEPENVAENELSLTGRYLKKLLLP